MYFPVKGHNGCRSYTPAVGTEDLEIFLFGAHIHIGKAVVELEPGVPDDLSCGGIFKADGWYISKAAIHLHFIGGQAEHADRHSGTGHFVKALTAELLLQNNIGCQPQEFAFFHAQINNFDLFKQGIFYYIVCTPQFQLGQCFVGYSHHQFAVRSLDAFYFIQIAVNNCIFCPGLQGVNGGHTLNDELVFVVKTVDHAVRFSNKKFVISLLEDGVISAVAFRHGYAVIVIEFGGFYDLGFGGGVAEKFHFRKFHRKIRPGPGGFEPDKSAYNGFVFAFESVFHQFGFGAAIFVT